MGAFCVYGISKSVCRAKAEKKVPTVASGGRALSPEEWGMEVKIQAASLFLTEQKLVKVSPEFDAPQFCRDWIAVAPGDVRRACIMVRGPKVDKQGNPVLRDGAPVLTWLPYDDSEKWLRPPEKTPRVDAPSAPVPKQIDRPKVKADSRPEVRFRNPDDPMQTWTGRGKQPRWVADWAQGGKSLDALRVPGVAA